MTILNTSETLSMCTMHTYIQHSKINHKTDLIVRELTDLIASQPSPSGSHHTESSHLLLPPDKSFSTFESKLAGQYCKGTELILIIVVP